MQAPHETPEADAAAWHRRRARTIASSDRAFIRGLHTRRMSSLLAIVGLVLAQLTIASVCARLALGWVVVLSATVGAFCAWGLHSFMHDVTHRSVALTDKPRVQAVLLRLCALTYPDLALYLYYRWHHLAHHRQLGHHGVQEVVFGHDHDVDVLAVSAYYRARRTHDSRPSSATPALFRSTPAKLLVGLLPLVDYILTSLLFTRHGLSFLATRLRSGANLTPRRLHAKRSALVHLLVVIGFQAGIWALFGWQAFVYLLLSLLFVKGLAFHPYLLFWLTIHKTTHHPDQCQPTTSTYGPLTTRLFWGLSNHVEHHDFPGVPSPDLAKLRLRFPDDYERLFAFASLADAYRQFFAADTAWVYGCQDS